MTILRTRVFLILLGLIGATVAAYFLTRQREYNLMLITVDTLRADYLSCYNPDARPTPNFDRIAKKSALFRNAYTVIPITLPAHTALLTSRHPHELRVFNNGDRFANQSPTLADVLRKAGYRTGAFVSLGVLRRKFGLSSGFETYDDDFSKTSGRHYKFASEVNQGAIPWIDEHRREPFFAWVHYSDPHEPYVSADAPPDTQVIIDGQTISRFNLARRERIKLQLTARPGATRVVFRAVARNDRNSRGSNRMLSGDVSLKSEHSLEARYEGWNQEKLRSGKTVRFFGEDESPAIEIVNGNAEPVPVEMLFSGGVGYKDVRDIWENYSHEVQYVDRFLGELWDQMERWNLLKRTIVVITADHGEGLKSHGYVGHVDNLYNETLRVPLMIYAPSATGGRIVDAPVNLLDIMPTLLDLLGEKNANKMEGRNVTSLVAPSRGDDLTANSDFDRWVYACTLQPEAPHNVYAATNGRIKLIHTPARKARLWEAYNLEKDPLEKKNLAFTDGSRLKTLSSERSALESYKTRIQALHKQRKNPALEPEEEEMLQALGYTAGSKGTD